ncbi:DHH family phosphoesterase [Candidatus Woesearchaeota archaeon]|nr:DHH family phosphoesterase [Candidatus Woesearchaeota archaeon]
MLTNQQIDEIRKELQECKNPLFFFHDDADGLASFLLFYRYAKEGHGVVIKTTPNIDKKFIRKVEEYNPDKIFILDIALVQQEFIDRVKTKIIWIDHHTPIKRYGNVKYYNPRVQNPKENIPASFICYQVVKQDLWIAMIGSIGDWYWPDFAQKFKKDYSDLLPEQINKPEDALFETRLGKLIRTIEFSLKGKAPEALKCVKILTRIKSPYDIIDEKTPAGKYIVKRADKIGEEYQLLLKKALKTKPEDSILIFYYLHGKISFTKDLSNELIHRFPNKIIIVARERKDEMKLSLRSTKINLLPILQKSLKGIKGFGGGHEHACGANVDKKDFERFIETFKKLI